MQAADVVVEEIKKAGGKAVANYDSVENGDAIIDTAIKNFGRIDILINNAGILRDVSFKNMKDQDWDLINKVHVYGAYKVKRSSLVVSDGMSSDNRIVRSGSLASLPETEVRSCHQYGLCSWFIWELWPDKLFM